MGLPELVCCKSLSVVSCQAGDVERQSHSVFAGLENQNNDLKAMIIECF